ncbi:hypothetical protein HDV00_004722 [Rhizophlyctis rosea]|nr:hypothetical protein HDV00_004722 [Rhizophlyctis rosea]
MRAMFKKSFRGYGGNKTVLAIAGAVTFLCMMYSHSLRPESSSDRRQNFLAQAVKDMIREVGAKHREEAFRGIFNSNSWQSDESRSGPGSEMNYTVNARRFIAEVIETLNIKTFMDVPCGDFNWQHHIESFNKIKYIGADIVPDIVAANQVKYRDLPNVSFRRHDLVMDKFTYGEADIIMTRDAIQHNLVQDGLTIIANIEDSGAKYLISNFHLALGRPIDMNINFKWDMQPGGWYLVDLMRPPFNFSKPLAFIREGVLGKDREGKTMAVWKLPALGLGDGMPLVNQVPERAEREVVWL